MISRMFPGLLTILSVSACLMLACRKQITPVPAGDGWCLYASDQGYTKTVTDVDEYSVKWAEGDMLSVFIAPTGTGEYSGNLKFVCDDTSAGRFVPAEGVVVPYEAGLSYDWRAVYPYDSSLSSADQISRIASNQTQNGNGNTVHLGQYDILAGNASNASVPSIVMRHQGTLLRWTVRNASQSPISVKAVIFDNGKEEYKLDVASDEEIQYGSAADFFMVASPFEIEAGKDVSISIVTSVGTQVQCRSFLNSKSFAAAALNTAVVVYGGQGAAPVFSLAKESGKWHLYCDKQEMTIKGAAANHFYDKLVAVGGNVIRTYSAAQTKEVLQTLKTSDVFILSGIAMGAEENGFDYGNKTAVSNQKARIREEVSSLCSEPRILGWILGNELDASYTDSRVWDAVEDAASMIKGIDDRHLVTTALAGVKKNAVTDIIARTPSLDFLSINAYYASALNVADNLAGYGWSKPWILSEFGPRGTWNMSVNTEPPLTSWGACVEQTSTQKASVYKEILASASTASAKGCIGSCAFVWGYQNHGAVLTWYGLFDKKGYAFAAVDELQYAWTGSYPQNRAPVIADRKSMAIDGKMTADDNVALIAGSRHTAKVTAISPCGASLAYKWLIYKEGDHSADGSLLEGISGLFDDDSLQEVSFAAPNATGWYRLVVFVSDAANRKVASAVIPINIVDENASLTPDNWKEGATIDF